MDLLFDLLELTFAPRLQAGANLLQLTLRLTWTYLWAILDLLMDLPELTFWTDRGVEEAQRGGGGARQLQEAQQDELAHVLDVTPTVMDAT